MRLSKHIDRGLQLPTCLKKFEQQWLKDFISGEAILNFLAEKILPLESDLENNYEYTSSVHKDKELTETEAKELNKLLTFDDEADVVPPEYESGYDMSEDGNWETLLELVAQLISQNKYMILKEMVKQGMLRLVIENGVIETRLHFYAYSTKRNYEYLSHYRRDTTRKTSGGGLSGSLFGLFGGGYSSKTTRTSINVSTARSGETTNDTTRVHLYGGVKLNFKTDYLKLTE
ncbi:MAG: hypothetical protein SWH68_03460 [Thermodesulfobacteriota bacterium]|nr:hypothetical protein [Thermodesulfobacteriota bacterium]